MKNNQWNADNDGGEWCFGPDGAEQRGHGMGGEAALEVIAANRGDLEVANTLISGVYDQYFTSDFGSFENRKQARDKIGINLEYIAAVLMSANSIISECLRDMDAAEGVETTAVKAFIGKTRKLYGAFLDEPAQKGGATE